MPPSEDTHSGRYVAVVIISVLLLLAVGGGLWWWLKSAPPLPEKSADAPPPSAKVRAKIESPPDIVIEDPDTPSASRTLMDERKTRLGLETGVDLVVREDETVQIGDVRIPMAEILDKIRLKEGGFVEDELLGTPDFVQKNRKLTAETAGQRHNQIEARIGEIDNLLADPRIQDNSALISSLQQEQEDLIRTRKSLKQYLENQERLAAVESRIAGGENADLSQLAKIRDDLRQTQAGLEESIRSDPHWQGDVGAYGIYIVRQGDNVWNIHFEFLQNYFIRKGIILETTADEPTPQGISSGVGKILKFSENMVHIYNIRQRRLEVNLDLIHPLSKIVIFNLEKVFSMLRQIDHGNVQRVEFDGETLWVPADQ